MSDVSEGDWPAFVDTRLSLLECAHAAFALRVLRLVSNLNGMGADDISAELHAHARELRDQARAMVTPSSALRLVKRIEDAAHHLDAKPRVYPADWGEAPKGGRADSS